MMRRFILLSAVLLAPLSARAAEAPALPVDRLAMADRLIVAMQLDKQFDAMIPQVVAMMLPMVMRGNEGKEGQVQRILTEEMTTAFATRRPDLVRNARDVYARNFTTQQLGDMLGFYDSPTGQVLVEKLPTVTLESMRGGSEIGQKAAMDALPRIVGRMRAAQLSVPSGT